MTYCLAWKKNNKIFFIADSALSEDMTDENEKFTSFGELQNKYGNYYIYEGLNKLTVINENVVVCFSGIVSRAYEMINVFKDGINYGLGVMDAVQTLKNSIDCYDVSLIVGYMEDNQANLLRFDGDNIIEGDYFDIGSGSDVQDWRTSVEKWFGFDFPVNHLLGIMVAVIQIESMHKHMFKWGVGGTFTGIQLDYNGVRWCSDLSFMLYSPAKSMLGFITILNRQDLIATLSTFNSAIKLIPGYKHLGLSAEIILDKIGDIDEQLRNAETDYLVLTNIFRKKIVVMYIDKCLHNKLFKMWRRRREKETDYLLVFEDTISDYLFSSKHGDDEEMTLHFLNIHTLKDKYISLVEFEKLADGRGNIKNQEEYY